MLTRLVPTALSALLCACASVTALAPQDVDPSDFGADIEGTDVRVAAEFGQREFTNSGWDQLESQSVLGFTGSHEPPQWPLGMDLGLYCSSDGGTLGTARLDLVTWEGYGGVMKSVTFLDGRLILQGGAGAAVTYLATDADDRLQSSEDATWVSGYARASVAFQISPEFEFGLSWRSARGGNFDIAGVDLDGDYDQVAFTLGASW